MKTTQRVLLKLIRLLNGKNIYWIVGGRTGLILQGVEVEDDGEIDICTTKEGAYAIEKILKPYQIDKTNYQESPTFKAYVAKYLINGITVEVMGEPVKLFENGEWMGIPSENVATIEFAGQPIRVFTLESELNYYRQTAKEKPERKVITGKISKQLNLDKGNIKQ